MAASCQQGLSVDISFHLYKTKLSNYHVLLVLGCFFYPKLLWLKEKKEEWKTKGKSLEKKKCSPNSYLTPWTTNTAVAMDYSSLLLRICKQWSLSMSYIHHTFNAPIPQIKLYEMESYICSLHEVSTRCSSKPSVLTLFLTFFFMELVDNLVKSRNSFSESCFKYINTTHGITKKPIIMK